MLTLSVVLSFIFCIILQLSVLEFRKDIRTNANKNIQQYKNRKLK